MQQEKQMHLVRQKYPGHISYFLQINKKGKIDKICMYTLEWRRLTSYFS